MYSQPVLIVDDDPLFTFVATNVLEALGVTNIQTASNGQEGLEILQRNFTPFGLILLDLMMPKLNGQAFLNTVRATGFAGNVAICSDEAEEVIEMTRNLGEKLRVNIVGAVKKPITVDHMAEILQRCTDVSGPTSVQIA